MFRKKDPVPPPKAPVHAAVPPKGRPVAPGVKETGEAPATGSKGKLAYEARRAEKAGMGLEKWMAEKDRRVKAERDAVQRARQKAAPEKKPGLLRRLLDRAHRPI